MKQPNRLFLSAVLCGCLGILLFSPAQAQTEAVSKRPQSVQSPAGSGNFNEELSAMDRNMAGMKAKAAANGYTSQVAPRRVDTQDREMLIRKIFKDGQAYYDRGDYTSATAQWEKIIPLVPDGQSLAVKIKEFRDFWNRSKTPVTENKTTDKQVALFNEIVISQTVQKITDLLGEAQSKTELEKKEAEEREAKSKQDFDTKQASVNSAFEQGSALFKQGKISGAVSEWYKIAPYMQDSERFKDTLDKIEPFFEQAQAEKKNVEDLQSKRAAADRQQFQTISDIVTNMVTILKREILEAKEKSAKAQFESASQETSVQLAFEKGDALYKQGKISEAIQVWDSLLSKVKDGQKLKGTLAEIQQLSAQAQAAKKNNEEEQSQRALAQSQQDQNFTGALTQIATRLKQEAGDAEAKASKARSDFSSQQVFIKTTFEKGSALYNEGKISEAVSVWETIPSKTDGGEKYKPILDEIRASLAQTQTAKKSLQDGESQSKSAQEQWNKALSDTLTNVSAQLKKETQDSKDRTAKSQAELADQRVFVQSAFEKGNSLYKEGKLSEAVSVWESVLPKMDNGEKYKPVLEEIKASLAQTQTAKKSEGDGESERKSAQEQWSKTLSDTLANISTQLKKETQSSKDRTAKSQVELADQRVFIQAAFQKGNALYQEGKIPEALQSWESILPKLEDHEKLGPAFEEVRKNYQLTLIEGKNAAQAEAQNRGLQFKSPEAFDVLLKEANDNLKAQAADARARREKAERSVFGKQNTAPEIFQNGSTLYNKGKISEAIDEWTKLLPYIREDELKDLLKSSKSNYDIYGETRKAAAEAEAKDQAFKVQWSQTLSQTLTDLNGQLKSQIDSSKNRQAKAVAALTYKENLVQSSFEKGTALFREGRTDEAFKIWQELLPQIEESDKLHQLISEFQANSSLASQSRQAADTAEVRKDHALFPVPAELSSLLTDANNRLRAEIQQSKNREADAQTTMSNKEAFVQSALQKSLALFREGNSLEAMVAWNSALPYLDDSTVIREFEVRTLAAAKARKSAEEAVTKQYAMKFKLPDEFKSLLTEANAKLELQAQKSKELQTQAEEAYQSKQALIVQTAINKGKLFYQSGDLQKALQEWSSLVPYMEEKDPLKDLVAQTQAVYQTAENFRKAADEAVVRQNSAKFKTPQELTDLLNGANDKMKAQIQESKAKQDKVLKDTLDRQTFVQSNLEKAKASSQQGDWPSALVSWNAALPYMENGASFAQSLKDIQKNYEDAQASKKLADGTESSTSKKIPLTKDTGDALSSAIQDLRIEAQKDQVRKKDAEDKIEERRRWVESSFQKGQALYQQGHYKEAYTTWNGLVPYVEDGDSLTGILSEFNKSASALEYTQSLYQETLEKQKGGKFKAPADLTKILQEGIHKMTVSTSETLQKSEVAEANVSSLQTRVNLAFLDGMVLYEQGKYEQAFQTWEPLLPYLENGSRQKTLIEQYRQQLKNNPIASMGRPMAVAGIPLKKGEVEETTPYRKTNHS